MPQIAPLKTAEIPPGVPVPSAAQRSGWAHYQKFDVVNRQSSIDGIGVFVAERVPARRKIGEIRGESISVVEARVRATRSERIMIVEVSSRRAIDFTHSLDPMRYTNHSCRPNARLSIRQGRVEFYALRDLEVGEEITVHYGESHHEGRLQCRCGQGNCEGRL